MMVFISVILKFYIVVLIFRWILTQQELTFNQIGRMVAKLTDPIFRFNNRPKSDTDKFIPLMIFGLIIIYGILIKLFTMNIPFVNALHLAFVDILTFIALFSVISLLIGLLPGSSGVMPLYFYRIGKFWVNIVRKIIPAKSNIVVVYAILVISVCYVTILTLFSIGIQSIYSDSISVLPKILSTTEALLRSYVSIFYYISIAIIIRALMSWVSPDPRNILVQFIIVVTEPIMMPFRRIIPPIGMIDLSAIVAIIALYVVRVFLDKGIVTLFSYLNKL